MKLVFESQEDGVTANQGFHLQQLAGAGLNLAAWNEPEHQEASGRQTQLPENNAAGALSSFIHWNSSQGHHSRIEEQSGQNQKLFPLFVTNWYFRSLKHWVKYKRKQITNLLWLSCWKVLIHCLTESWINCQNKLKSEHKLTIYVPI